MLLQATDIYLNYGTKPIIQHQNIYVEEGDKIGIVGSNGQGKSSLLKIIATLDSTCAHIVKKPDLSISYLPQTPSFDTSLTIEQLCLSLNQNQLYRFKSYLTKFKIDDFETAISTFSGGNQRKVDLALTLCKEADLLLLDEPTNHLDIDMIVWLEKFLPRYKGAVMMVTHDRYFLNRITPTIIEISNGHLYKSLGGYQGYLEDVEMRRKELLNRQKRHAAILRVEKAWAMAGVEARRTKSKDRLARYEQLKKQTFELEKNEMNMAFGMNRLGRKTIVFQNVSKAYGSKVLFKDFNYQIQLYDRIGIIGENGAGKTSLLNVLCRRDDYYDGVIEVGETIQFGYFDQLSQHLNLEMRAYEYIKNISDAIETKDGILTAKQMMEQFLFDDTTMYLPIGRLSGGQKRRLYLLSILMKQPNVLVLDEPTNDLDIETLSVLENYIEDFKGIVITVSHDRYFLDKVCDTLFILNHGNIDIYTGSCSDYLETHQIAQEKKKEPQVFKEKEKKIKLTYRQKQRLDELSTLMPTIETSLAAVMEQFNQEDLDYSTIQELSSKQKDLEAQLEKLTLEWMELQEIQENSI